MDKRFGLKARCIESIIDVLKLQNNVEEAVIFGSRAMGNNKNGSDIDIAIKGNNLKFDDVSDIRIRLDELPYAYTYDIINYHKISNKALTAHIDELGITFYKKEQVPNNWKTVKLGEIAELRKEQIVPNGNEQPYIGLEHIEQQSLRLKSLGSSKDVISNKFKFYSGDILYGKLRPYFRKVYKPNFDGVCSTDIYVIKNKKNIDNTFLFYLVASENFTNLANSGSSGPRMPRANWEQLQNSEWNIPENINTQTTIAYILSSLDDKIEINRSMNHTLEVIAQAIFKEWFVNFNFPGFDGQLVDGLPKGWKKCNLTALLDTVSKTNKFLNDKVIFLNTSDILEGEVLHHNYSLPGDLPGQAKKTIEKGDILFSEIRPENKRYTYVDFDADDYVVSTKLMVLRTKGIVSSLVLYFYLKSSETLLQLQSLAESRSGTFPQITFTELSKIEFTIPDEKTLNIYDVMIESIFSKIRINQKEIQTLIAIRDSLLPKLMTGKIEVNA